MTEQIGQIARIVWLEPGDTRTRAVSGRIRSQTEDFLIIDHEDERQLTLREAYIVKIEVLPETPTGDPR